ncbi:MAG: protein kinase [Planctomycetes bacterium]|nr:protein kinase [Planctomycetota bacterium]
MPTVTCPNPSCGERITVPDDALGKMVQCPQCTTEVFVPGDMAPTIVDEMRPKTRLGHLEIISLIGKGGMGEVYKARNLKLNKIVAVKLLSGVLAGRDSGFVERFLREAQSGARLEHPNVVPVYFVGAADDQYFIEMQYIDGLTLEDLIKKGGEPDVMEATRVILDAARGIAEAHDNGIVHRDIKPANIMIDLNGNVKVADFGLAKLEERTTAVTASGQIMGTPHYMSPEQCEGQEADARSDIYALGATYYHAVTGEFPYLAETLLGLMRQHTASPVPNPSAKNPNVPPEVAAIIRKAMAKNPEDRYQSCRHMIAELERVLKQMEGGPAFRPVRPPKQILKPVPTPGPTKRPIPTAKRGSYTWLLDVLLIGGIIVALVVVCVYLPGLYRQWQQEGAEETPAPPRNQTKPEPAPRPSPEPAPAPGPGLGLRLIEPKPRPAIEMLTAEWSDWRALFDGKDLGGWTLEGGEWKVEDGNIVSTGNDGSTWRIACTQNFGGSGIELEYYVKGSDSLGAWINVNGQEVRFAWGGAPSMAGLDIGGRRGERTTIHVDPTKKRRVRIKLNGEWATYSIDYIRTGPEALALPQQNNTFQVGLATEKAGVRYSNIRVKILTLRQTGK